METRTPVIRRPYVSHFLDGAEAYGLSAGGDPSPPWPEGSLASLSWRAGFLTERARDPFAAMLGAGPGPGSDGLDPEEEARIRHDADATMARRTMQAHLGGMRAALPAMESVEAAIGEKAPAWRLRCAEISNAILNSGVLAPFEDAFGPLREAYGIYDGPVAEGSPFPQGPSRHGWLESPSGHVVDPTRWVFEHVAPYIHVGEISDYDIAGIRLREDTFGRRAPPAFDPKAPGVDWSDLGDDVLDALSGMLGDAGLPGRGTVTKDQVHWLANDGEAMLGPHGGVLLDAMRAGGQGVYVPIDVARLIRPPRRRGPAPGGA